VNVLSLRVGYGDVYQRHLFIQNGFHNLLSVVSFRRSAGFQNIVLRQERKTRTDESAELCRRFRAR